MAADKSAELERVLDHVKSEEEKLGRRLEPPELIDLFMYLHHVHMPGLADRVEVADFLKAKAHQVRDELAGR